MFGWMIDAFFWLVLPIAILEAVRVARAERKRQRRSIWGAIGFASVELVAMLLCAATSSPLLFALVFAARLATVQLRERDWWWAGLLKGALLVAAMAMTMTVGHTVSFADVARASVDPTLRLVIVVLICAACVVAIVPTRITNETKESLTAPFVLIAFARLAMPLGREIPQFTVVVPIVAAVIALVCALWLLSAGSRANHFEPATLVSELLECERGVVLSFVWLGLAAGEHLTGVGALLEWWSGALALLALEASLRRRPLPKPMAFFALAMAVSLPGTVGFVAEDLLAHGLLELRPLLAAAFVGVAALNAAALYLALVNIIVDLRGQQLHAGTRGQPEVEAPPSIMMLVAAGLSVLIGVVPRPFVAEAALAHDVIAGTVAAAEPHAIIVDLDRD